MHPTQEMSRLLYAYPDTVGRPDYLGLSSGGGISEREAEVYPLNPVRFSLIAKGKCHGETAGACLDDIPRGSQYLAPML